MYLVKILKNLFLTFELKYSCIYELVGIYIFYINK